MSAIPSILREIGTARFNPRKHSITTVELHGVKFDCVYEVEGQHIPATDDMPEEWPSAYLVDACIGGVSVMSLVDEFDSIKGDLEHEIEKELRK